MTPLRALPFAFLLPLGSALASLQISEFQAENLDTVDDEEWNSSDWIEIRNTGDEVVDLKGWFLTDDPGDLGKWEFPSLKVAPGEEIVVWASEKNQHTPLTIFQGAQPLKSTHTNFKLDKDGEYLALVQPDEVTVEHEYAPEYPPQVGNISYGIGADGQVGYLHEPTPGAPNGDVGDLGPYIEEVQNLTGQPNLDDHTEIVIMASVLAVEHPVAKVTLHHRFDFKAEARTTMRDDGQGADETADDGIYTASIELASIFGLQVEEGGMIRWRVEAEDDQGNSQRLPLFHNPLDSDEYFGTVVQDPELASSKLPVFHWFIQNPSAAQTRPGTRASVMFLGEFYDNILADLHGQSTSNTSAFPKSSYDFDFNKGHRFRYHEDEGRAKDMNMLTSWADKSKVRNTMAYEMYAMSGVKGHWAFPVRIQENGEFKGTWDMVEDGDDVYLDRAGLDARGALYKMYDNLSSASQGEKKSRLYENKDDLQALITGVGQGADWFYDNIDLSNTINFLAANSTINNTDYGHKNYYVYRDTEGTGEWRELPWDVDLSLGRRWISSHTYFYDPIQTTSNDIEGHVHGNRLATVIMGNSTFNEMLWRRLRTLYDEFYGPPGGEPNSDYMLRRLDELVELIDPEDVVSDADLDYEKYLPLMESRMAVNNGWDNIDTMREAVARIRDEYIPGRRDYVYGLSKLPKAQSDSSRLKLAFTDTVYRPESGNPEEEYLAIQNTSGESVDISGWKIAGGVDYTFRPGTVLLTGNLFSPERGKVFVTRNLRAFRARAASPKAGENIFAQGDYEGQLSARGETLQLIDREGTIVTEHTFEGEPSDPQRWLRITEVLYNPMPPEEGSPWLAKDFEFLELKNIGTESLDLSGVAFTDGITLAFEDGASLAAGAYGVVVSNRAAFQSRHGEAVTILGEFDGNLSNGGERIELRDAYQENVLAFSYDQTWSEAADLEGHSLVVADEAADVGAWDVAEGWLTSAAVNGTPGAANDSDPEPSGMTYLTWKMSVFTEAEQTDDAVSGPMADPHGQGVTNLLAYGFHLAPGSELLAAVTPAGELRDGHLTVSYRRNRLATDLIFRVETSADLKTWTEISSADEGAVPMDEATEWVTVSGELPVDEAIAEFLRVRVEMK